MQNTYDITKIRNFSIIAHIDHGKSTLADRILEQTGSVSKRDSSDRMLDTLELEKERGITIKLQTARMNYKYSGNVEEFKRSSDYVLNLVDTPGHVDFSYEVSRSLASSEGALLLIDATQGIQAQTFTTVYKAMEYNLEIIPVINKIDLPNIDLKSVISSVCNVFGFTEDEILLVSGKTGQGVDKLLERIVEKIPSPKPNVDIKDTKALVYDSFYHEYKGVVALIKLFSGTIESKSKIKMFATETELDPIEIGNMHPDMRACDVINTGEIGYIATGLKDIKAIHVGDTMTIKSDFEKKDFTPLIGYKPPKPMVYAGLFPIEADRFSEFKEALGKLSLNDAALDFKKESSPALGSGYLCGFLGLLHMEITQERLDREFGIDLITTNPSVEYKMILTTKDWSKIPMLNITNVDEDGFFHIHTSTEFPETTLIDTVYEPWVKLEILTPETYIGPIMELSQKNRGIFINMQYISNELFNNEKHVTLVYEIPTAEIITNYFDKLKSISQGYASMDYNFIEYRKADIVKVNIMVNHEIVEALSFLSHSSNSEEKGKKLVSRLAELIPRQQIPIPIQASIGMKVFARETIKAYRKDVLAKMSGGDITRKMKLLEKQKKGKKKLTAKMVGNVKIPQDVFVKALKID